MKFRNYVLLLLAAVCGCDIRSAVLPSAPLANNPSRQGRQLPARPESANELAEIEQRLLKEPDNLSLLKTKAILLQGRAEAKIQRGDRESGYADYQTSGEIWRKIKTAKPELNRQDAAECARSIYNLACALSLQNEIDPALGALRESVEAGFANMERFENDSDLDPLREEPGFRALLKELPRLRMANAKTLIAADSLFPFEFHLSNVDDKPIASSDYLGKVLLVDIGGTWCRPGRQGISGLVALHRKFKEQGFDAVGIHYEREANPSRVRQIIRDHATANGITHECVIGDERTAEQIPGFGVYPTSLLVDRQGRVRAKFEGAQTYETLESVVELLLSETSGSAP